MKRFNYNVAKLRNPSNGFEGLPAIAGESAYEIAVRLGTFTGTEEEWNNYIKTERDAAIKAIQDKAKEIMESIPEDYTVLSSEVNELKGDLVEITETESFETTMIVDTTFHDGFIRLNGTEASLDNYKYTDKILVSVGDVIYIQHNSDTNNHTSRVVTAYNGDTAISEKGQESVLTYTVPEGIDGVVVTFFDIGGNFYIKRNTTVVTKNPKGISELNSRVEVIERKFTSKFLSANASNLASNSTIYIAIDDNALQLDLKKNCVYEFFSEFDSMGKLYIRHGNNVHDSGYILIDSDNIEIHYYNGITGVDQIKKTFAHGLTISNFVSVNISINEKSWVTVRLTTTSGTYKTDTVGWTGCNGLIEANGNFDMRNVKLSYYPTDLKKDVVVFGDSYTSIGGNRWPYYLIFDDNITNFAVCGFAGAKSTDEIKSFRTMLKLKKPKTVVWALGMNDNDAEDSVNTDWKTCIDEVIASCDANGIELVLATIPNVPNIIHTFKNAYVRNSGKRYVDFAKVVGAEAQGSSWYSGMLSADNVHPSELGARALASRFLVDVPEVIN